VIMGYSGYGGVSNSGTQVGSRVVAGPRGEGDEERHGSAEGEPPAGACGPVPGKEEMVERVHIAPQAGRRVIVVEDDDSKVPILLRKAKSGKMRIPLQTRPW
jgi:hypothetical protein